jgi:hypothetical protein
MTDTPRDQRVIRWILNALECCFGVATSAGGYQDRAEAMHESRSLIETAPPSVPGCIFYSKEDSTRASETGVLTLTYVPRDESRATCIFQPIEDGLTAFRYNHAHSEQSRCFDIIVPHW